MAKHKSFGALLALSGTWDKTLFYRYISGFVPAPGGAAEGDAGMASCFSKPNTCHVSSVSVLLLRIIHG